MKASALSPGNAENNNPTATRGISVALYDQIVTVGGIRFFEYELLRQWARIGKPAGCHFTVFWPQVDSIGHPLDWPFSSGSVLQLRSIQSDPLSRIVRYLLTSQRLSSIRGIGRARRTVGGWISRSSIVKIRGLACPFDWMLSQTSRFDLLYLPNPARNLPDGSDPTFSRPLVITLHDLAHEFTNSWGERTDLIRREVVTWCRLASGIVFSSEFVRQQAIKLYQIPESKTFCVYLAPAIQNRLPSSEDIDGVLSKYNLPRGYALCLGTSVSHKGHLTIIKGFARLRREHGVNLPLVIAGPHTDAFIPGTPPISEYRLSVQQTIRDLGFIIDRDLFCLGFVPESDMPALYLGSSMVVTASQSEAGLNAMIFDGMWYEKPIICSNIPQFTERLGESGNNAYIFELGSDVDLAAKVRMSVREPIQTTEMLKRAKQFVTARTWADAAQDYLGVFEQVLSHADTASGILRLV